jgi:hypothetical protein
MDSDTIELSSLEPFPEFRAEVLEEFPVLDREISYEEFFRNFIVANVPCLLTVEGPTKGWRSLADWACPDGKKCDLNFFRTILAPNLIVPVSDCGSKYFNSQEKVEMSFEQYLSYWNERENENSGVERCLYLKDWHFCRDCPTYKGIAAIEISIYRPKL